MLFHCIIITGTLVSISNTNGDNNIQTSNNIMSNRKIHNIGKIEG